MDGNQPKPGGEGQAQGERPDTGPTPRPDHAGQEATEGEGKAQEGERFRFRDWASI